MASLFDVNPNSTLGLALIGFAGSCALYGVLCNQIHMYFSRYPTDRAAYKAIVIVIWLFETVDQALIGHSVYYYTVTTYSQPLFFLAQPPTWSVFSQILLSAVVGCIVKLAFTWRVYTFSGHNIFVAIFLAVLALGQLGLATTLTVKSFLSKSALLQQLSELQIWGTLSLGLGVLTDVCTAAALCFYLQRIRKSSSRADSMGRGLMRHALDTGILTSLASLSALIAYRVNSNNFAFLLFYFLLSKLYATTFLAALNTRRSLAAGVENGSSYHGAFMMTTPSRQRLPNVSIGKSLSRADTSTFNVKIERTQEISFS